MRVLFYYSARDWSGSARAFAAAARVLADRGYQVTYACAPESAVERRVSYDGYDVVSIEEDTSWLGESVRLRTVLADRFVEVVFVHTEREHLVASAAVRLAGRGAVVRRTPAGGRLDFGSGSRLAARLAATGFLFTSAGELHATAPVRGALDRVVADVGVDVLAYEGVLPASRQKLGGPAAAAVPPPSPAAGATRQIVCVYDPSARTRAATVLRTAALLAPRHPELQLALIGRGSDHEDLRMHAAALGLTHAVSHLGERDDALAVLAAADLGWVIADEDDAAYGALDLMALRVPVLAERGTIAERYVADGVGGMLLPPGDAPATAAAVVSLLARDAERAAMGNAGHVRVAREFTEAAMVDRFERAVGVARDRKRWTA